MPIFKIEWRLDNLKLDKMWQILEEDDKEIFMSRYWWAYSGN